MKNEIIEIFGKKVKIVDDTTEDQAAECRKCAFYGVWGCDICSYDGHMLCEDSNGLTNKHFELA